MMTIQCCTKPVIKKVSLLAITGVLIFYVLTSHVVVRHDTTVKEVVEDVVDNSWQVLATMGLGAAASKGGRPVSDLLIHAHSATSLDECRDKASTTRLQMRGTKYWTIYNYVRPLRGPFRCNESITYTTHTELNYLHNLEPLLERWKGPVSVALFTPGSDYQAALEAIFYYRQCRLDGDGKAAEPTLVSQYVTFHFYFPVDHLPTAAFMNEDGMRNYQADCDRPPPNVDRPGQTPFTSYKKAGFFPALL